MGEKDDGLGLSLSLRCPTEMNLPYHHHHHQPPPPPLPLNLMHSFSPLPFMLPHKPTISTFFHSPSHGHGEARSYLGGIDVNRPAPTADQDEEVGVSSPNSTVSSVSGKRSEREIENEAERASSSQEDDAGEAARKKLRLSKEQAAILEETFKEQNTLNPKQKSALASQLNLRPRQVEVWFQNRRARTKLKQTEVDCEYLRRCCENLTEENRQLQKEVNDLRALKLSPQLYMNMNPPTTLTMCPSCERVAVSSMSSSSATASSTIGKTDRNRNLVAPPLQRPMPTNSWAAVISRQPLDIHGPQS